MGIRPCHLCPILLKAKSSFSFPSFHYSLKSICKRWVLIHKSIKDREPPLCHNTPFLSQRELWRLSKWTQQWGLISWYPEPLTLSPPIGKSSWELCWDELTLMWQLEELVMQRAHLSKTKNVMSLLLLPCQWSSGLCLFTTVLPCTNCFYSDMGESQSSPLLPLSPELLHVQGLQLLCLTCFSLQP